MLEKMHMVLAASANYEREQESELTTAAMSYESNRFIKSAGNGSRLDRGMLADAAAPAPAKISQRHLMTANSCGGDEVLIRTLAHPQHTPLDGIDLLCPRHRPCCKAAESLRMSEWSRREKT